MFFKFGVDFDLFIYFCGLFTIFCYKDERVLISVFCLFCSFSERVLPIPLLIRISYYEDGLYGSRTISIARFSLLVQKFYLSIHCIQFDELCCKICTKRFTELDSLSSIKQTILLVDLLNLVKIFLIDLMKSIR